MPDAPKIVPNLGWPHICTWQSMGASWMAAGKRDRAPSQG